MERLTIICKGCGIKNRFSSGTIEELAATKANCTSCEKSLEFPSLNDLIRRKRKTQIRKVARQGRKYFGFGLFFTIALSVLLFVVSSPHRNADFFEPVKITPGIWIIVFLNASAIILLMMGCLKMFVGPYILDGLDPSEIKKTKYKWFQNLLIVILLFVIVFFLLYSFIYNTYYLRNVDEYVATKYYSKHIN